MWNGQVYFERESFFIMLPTQDHPIVTLTVVNNPTSSINALTVVIVMSEWSCIYPIRFLCV